MIADADSHHFPIAASFDDVRRNAQIFWIDWRGPPDERPRSGRCRVLRGGDVLYTGPFDSKVRKDFHGGVSLVVRIQGHDFAEGTDGDRIEIVWDDSDHEVTR